MNVVQYDNDLPMARLFSPEGSLKVVQDDLAILCSSSFYEWLGKGRSPLEAYELARTQAVLAGSRERIFVVKARSRKAASERFYGRPEVVAELQLNSRGEPIVCKGGAYKIHLWVRGAENFAQSVVYQLLDDSYDETEWEVSGAEDRNFKVYDFNSYGQIAIRVTAWNGDRGIGVASTLVDALRRIHGRSGNAAIETAIQNIAHN